MNSYECFYRFNVATSRYSIDGKLDMLWLNFYRLIRRNYLDQTLSCARLVHESRVGNVLGR